MDATSGFHPSVGAGEGKVERAERGGVGRLGSELGRAEKKKRKEGRGELGWAENWRGRKKGLNFFFQG